jgi:hypothetical protein
LGERLVHSLTARWATVSRRIHPPINLRGPGTLLLVLALSPVTSKTSMISTYYDENAVCSPASPKELSRAPGRALGKGGTDGPILRTLLTGILFLFIAGFTSLAVYTGLNLGFGKKLGPEAYGRYLFAISSSLTSSQFGIKGYVRYLPIEGALLKHGFVQNDLLEAPMANHAITAALALGGGNLPLRSELSRQTLSTIHDDVGLVDFVRAAFALFGSALESLYLFYLTLFCTSVALFILAYYRSPEALLFLCFATATAYLLARSPLFTGDAELPTIPWVTPVEPRFMTTLGIIPFLHLVLAMCRAQRLIPATVVCLIGQAIILGFVCRIRASAYWMLVAAGLLTVAFVVWRAGFLIPRLELRYSKAFSPSPYPKSIFLRATVMPLVLLLAVMAAGALDVATRLHPAYRDGRQIAHHSFWHEAYYGLQHSHDWLPKFGAEHQLDGRPALGDEQPVAGLLRYLRAHPVSDPRDVIDDEGNLYWGALDRYLKLAFLDIALSDPGFVLHTMFVSKVAIAKAQFSSVARALLGSLSMPRFVLFLALVVCAASVLLMVDTARWHQYCVTLICLIICVPVTVLPQLLTTVSWQVMADTIFLGLVLGFALTSWALACGVTTAIWGFRVIRRAIGR